RRQFSFCRQPKKLASLRRRREWRATQHDERLGFCFAIDLNASSKSSADLTIVGRTVRPKHLATSWVVLSSDEWAGLSDIRTARRLAFGTTACSNSTLLTCSSPSKLVTPVTLPPGRARLSTSPEPTGSEGVTMTIGIVAVARLAARIAGVVSAIMTSGF